jgi:hypothetical protein
MRHGGRFILLGVVGLVLLASAFWLALGVEAVKGLVPPGSDELRIQALTASQLRFSYRLAFGQNLSTVVADLSNQGWVIYDDGARVLWPDQFDNSALLLHFRRSSWFHLVGQWLTVRRDATNPRMFTIDIMQMITKRP